MKVLRIVKQSFQALMANKGRTFLTTLGIIIGIGSVIGLISLGNGVQASITKQVSTLGSTTLTVLPGEGFGTAANGGDPATQRRQSFGSQQTLTRQDLQALREKKDYSISKISGTVSGSSVFTIDGMERRKTVNGVSKELFEIQNLTVASGRVFTQQDVDTESRVIVIGYKLARDVFGSENPLGQTMIVQENNFTVIGVLAEKTESSFTNPNNNAFIPDTTAQNVFNVTTYNNFVIQAKDESTVDAAKSKIEAILLESHNINDLKLADFSVASSKDLLSTISQITGLLTTFLAGIAAISLVVGGIGIMNIMLVAVTERTKEIGLRKAVGAKTSDIMAQFILDAIILTLLGGFLGILLGYGIGLAASQISSELKPVVTLESILLAVGVSSLIGLVFGVYPAAKAALLNPIDALRYE